MLSNIQVVLVNTTLPANIGATARAMHTMGLSHLTVIEPRLPIDETSYAHAAGGTSVLDNVTILPSLDAALAPCSLVMMASARSRHLPRPVISPIKASAIAYSFLVANPTAKIALVFGREDRGLTNDELALGDYHIQIPANPDYPVLNVASSVQVIASYFYEHFQTQDITGITATTAKHTLSITQRTEWDEPAITFEQKLALEDATIKLLTQLDLANDNNLKDLPKRLSRLLSRLQLDQKEYALIRALLARLHDCLHD